MRKARKAFAQVKTVLKSSIAEQRMLLTDQAQEAVPSSTGQ